MVAGPWIAHGRDTHTEGCEYFSIHLKSCACAGPYFSIQVMNTSVFTFEYFSIHFRILQYSLLNTSVCTFEYFSILACTFKYSVQHPARTPPVPRPPHLPCHQAPAQPATHRFSISDSSPPIPQHPSYPQPPSALHAHSSVHF